MYERTIRKLNDWEHAKIAEMLRAPKPERLSLWQRLSRYISGETAFRKKLEKKFEIAYQTMTPKCREVLDDGQVVVHHVRSDAMAVLRAWEDEDDLCFFDIGDGQLFCMLAGNGLWPSTEEEWGNTDFKFAHTLKHSLGHWIYCYGDELVPIPSREIRSKEFIVVPHDLRPAFVFDGTIDTFADDFKRYVQAISSAATGGVAN